MDESQSHLAYAFGTGPTEEISQVPEREPDQEMCDVGDNTEDQLWSEAEIAAKATEILAIDSFDRVLPLSPHQKRELETVWTRSKSGGSSMLQSNVVEPEWLKKLREEVLFGGTDDRKLEEVDEAGLVNEIQANLRSLVNGLEDDQ